MLTAIANWFLICRHPLRRGCVAACLIAGLTAGLTVGLAACVPPPAATPTAPPTATPTALPTVTPTTEPTAAPTPTPTAPPAGRRTAWLVIERLDAFGAFAGSEARVTATVNDVDYVYPSLSGIEWLEIGPTMSAQSFRLPATADVYVIRFSAEVRPSAGGETSGASPAPSQLISVQEDVINVPADLPYAGTYGLHLLNDQSRAARVSAEVVYCVTYDP